MKIIKTSIKTYKKQHIVSGHMGIGYSHDDREAIITLRDAIYMYTITIPIEDLMDVTAFSFNNAYKQFKKDFK